MKKKQNNKTFATTKKDKQLKKSIIFNDMRLYESLSWLLQQLQRQEEQQKEEQHRNKYCPFHGEEEVVAIVEAIIETVHGEMAIIKAASSSNDNHKNKAGGINSSEQENASFEFVEELLYQSLLDYLSPDVSDEQAREMSQIAFKFMVGDLDSYKHNDSNIQREENGDSDDNDDDIIFDNDNDNSHSDDEDNYVQEGECELCEREVKLTRHHLIPRSTWPRIKPRFLQAAHFYEEGNMEKVEEVLGIGSPLPESLTMHHFTSGARVKQFLSCYTCDICSMCHKTVHNTFDNLELAERRNNVEKLLEDERIRKFCQWANKQRSRSKRIHK